MQDDWDLATGVLFKKRASMSWAPQERHGWGRREHNGCLRSESRC
jgi:hypothetical protein